MNAGSSDGASGTSTAAAKKHSRKPKYSRFTQQELPACKPIVTPSLVIAGFFLVGVLFIPVGLTSLSASKNVVEIVDRYERDCIPSTYNTKKEDMVAYIKSPTTDKTCIRTLIVPKRMKQPIFIYYQLDKFYQNHRRYVKSRNDQQLRSAGAMSDKDLKDCIPHDKINDKDQIVPCGLIAWSLFNDTYRFTMNNRTIQVNRKGIAWKSDIENKFGSDVYPKNFQSNVIGGAKLNEKIPLSEQEDLMVWMRTAALPIFRKPYGKIEEDLDANQKITVVIQNNYNTYAFGGRKKLVLSTTTWIGGKNDVLGYAYLIVGGLCIVLAISFTILSAVRPRHIGDPSYLSWNKNPAGTFT